ncbi:MAG: hypothetical protein JWM33_3226 [Caulobacteraceae bacterium]|nr:hypothetical protein [Caulobacteraceae bacterium]
MDQDHNAPRVRAVRGPSPSVATDIQPENPTSYEVGYGRPPETTRFPPGRSGNPKGRPRGRKNLNTMYREVLETKVAANIDGRARQVTALHAITLKRAHKAMQGDNHAADFLLNMAAMIEAQAEAAGEHRELPARDQQILARMKARLAIELAESDGEVGQ